MMKTLHSTKCKTRAMQQNKGNTAHTVWYEMNGHRKKVASYKQGGKSYNRCHDTSNVAWYE
jgi:hypothetical protein